MRRPEFHLRAPRFLWNSLRTATDGKTTLPIRVSVGKPFDRTVTLHVRHTSVMPRQVTVQPEGIFVDRHGRQIPFIRLASQDATMATQEIPPGGRATWTFG